MKAQRALESGTHVNIREAKNLSSYFQKVRHDVCPSWLSLGMAGCLAGGQKHTQHNSAVC